MIKEAVEEYEFLKGDEEIQRIAFLKRKYELDHNNALYHAQKQGEAIGEKAKQIEIAKKMKVKGMEIDIIAELTGLTKEEIESL